MSSRTRERMKGRRNVRGFSMLVHEYFQSEQYAKLTPRAVKLLVDLLCQYRGANNGDLTTAWSEMRKRGWRSKDLLAKARTELEERGWIVRTRQGTIHAATLYALTFYGLNDCRDTKGQSKLEPGNTPDPKPLHLWKLPGYDKPPQSSKRRFKNASSSPRAGKGFPGSRVNVTPISPYLSRQSGQ
jgi:hypothetical protein